MKYNVTTTPDAERLFFEERDNGDLVVNREKSSFFLVVATGDEISVESSLCLNGAKILQFLKAISHCSEEFVTESLNKFLEVV